MTDVTKQIIEMTQELIRAGYTQKEIAERIGVQRATVSLWAKGKAQRLSHTYIPFLKKLIRAHERKK